MIFLGGGAFDFRFGNEVTTSGDKKREILRENLSEVKLILIDEMSLVSADQLYKIDAKLREVFHLNKHIPFGGIGIVLVGDLLQIPPVKRPKFEKSGVAFDVVEYDGKSYSNKLDKNQKTLI